MNPEISVFYVRIVTAHAGGEFTSEPDIRFSSKRTATETCERLQAEFDVDCDPKRAYVLDAQHVPLRAGGERRLSPLKSMHLEDAA